MRQLRGQWLTGRVHSLRKIKNLEEMVSNQGRCTDVYLDCRGPVPKGSGSSVPSTLPVPVHKHLDMSCIAHRAPHSMTCLRTEPQLSRHAVQIGSDS